MCSLRRPAPRSSYAGRQNQAMCLIFLYNKKHDLPHTSRHQSLRPITSPAICFVLFSCLTIQLVQLRSNSLWIRFCLFVQAISIIMKGKKILFYEMWVAYGKNCLLPSQCYNSVFRAEEELRCSRRLCWGHTSAWAQSFENFKWKARQTCRVLKLKTGIWFSEEHWLQDSTVSVRLGQTATGCQGHGWLGKERLS